jgi:hypothetical protein
MEGATPGVFYKKLRGPRASPSSCRDDIPLPSLHEIWTTPIRTKEHLPSALLPLAREEFGKLLAEVARTNRSDAWEASDGWRGDLDGPRRKARDAWIHLLMFPKVVLRLCCSIGNVESGDALAGGRCRCATASFGPQWGRVSAGGGREGGRLFGAGG